MNDNMISFSWRGRGHRLYVAHGMFASFIKMAENTGALSYRSVGRSCYFTLLMLMLTGHETGASLSLGEVRCGVRSQPRSTRVIGGKPATPGQFPWAVRNLINMIKP